MKHYLRNIVHHLRENNPGMSSEQNPSDLTAVHYALGFESAVEILANALEESSPPFKREGFLKAIYSLK